MLPGLILWKSRWLHRTVWSLALLCLGAIPALGHFVYLVPAPDGQSVRVVFSETLEPDEAVGVEKLAALKLFAKTGDKTTPVALTPDGHSLKGALPEKTETVHGKLVYGITTRGDQSSLLVYHPKALVGSVPTAVSGATSPEVVVVKAQGGHRFQLIDQGKPVPNAEGSIVFASGKKEKVTTDKDGLSAIFQEKGQFGIWLRHTVAKAGMHQGKPYAVEKHYATLVGNLDLASAAWQPLPRAVSSLGAVVCDGFLYVYGGHCGKTHTYSTSDVLGTFQRLDLAGGKPWETLPSGPIAQGMNLVSHKGRIYRVGGMQPRNAPGQPADNHSLDTIDVFDPKTGQWSAGPKLPAGRSSHDAVVVGDRLVVVGGWEMKGKGIKPVWHDTTLICDLSAAQPVWTMIPQPFQRRALTATAQGNQVYVLCGLDAQGGQSTETDILDLTTRTWSKGPEVPGDRVGFSPAAATVGRQVLVNTFDGPLLRLKADGSAWETVGQAQKPRMVHRLVTHGGQAILVGGAARGGNVAELESIPLQGGADTPTSSAQ